MAKRKHPTKTAIRKILAECAFDPNADGPLKVIADVGNRDYYLNRAIEMIKGATDNAPIFDAVQLLALALAQPSSVVAPVGKPSGDYKVSKTFTLKGADFFQHTYEEGQLVSLWSPPRPHQDFSLQAFKNGTPGPVIVYHYDQFDKLFLKS